MFRFWVFIENITQINISWDVMSLVRYNYTDVSEEAEELYWLKSQKSI